MPLRRDGLVIWSFVPMADVPCGDCDGPLERTIRLVPTVWVDGRFCPMDFWWMTPAVTFEVSS